MSHLPFAYYGNKRSECKFFMDSIPLKDKVNIIEPFCGSASISFNIWLKHGNKFNYYLNDIDITILKYFIELKINGLDYIFSKINEIKMMSNTKETFKNLVKEYKEDDDIFKYICIKKLSLFGNYSCLLKKNLTSLWKKTKMYSKFEEFIKSPSVFITCLDWNECYNRHKDDSSSLFIFDPPYLDSFNDYYRQNPNLINIYDMLDEIKNDNATSIFIIEKIDKIEELFKNWIISIEYDKMYTISRKRTIHIMYSNR